MRGIAKKLTFYVAFEHLETGPEGDQSVDVVAWLSIGHVHVNRFHVGAVCVADAAAAARIRRWTACFLLVQWIVQVNTHVFDYGVVVTIEAVEHLLVA